MRLRDYMAEHKLKDEDVAKAIGVERATINRYRNGALRPSPRLMLAFQRWSKGAITLESWLEAAE